MKVILKIQNLRKNTNDDSIGLVYYMIGSDKLFSDIEVLIQNVISKKFDNVFKLVEIEKSDIAKFASKARRKTFYNKPSYKNKNTKAGLGYKKKQN
ncbi:hypothetical protein Hanom_Chr05g00418831 [Helianthus anomalus]